MEGVETVPLVGELSELVQLLQVVQVYLTQLEKRVLTCEELLQEQLAER